MDSIPVWLAYIPIPFFIACWMAATLIVSAASGWRGLAARFRRKAPTPPSAGPVLWTYCSGSMGRPIFPTSFKRILHAEISRDGLGLSLSLPFAIGARPLFIPWSQIEWAQRRTVLRFWTFSTIQVRASPIQISLQGDAGEAMLAAALARGIRPPAPRA